MHARRMVSAKLLLLLCGGCASGADESPALEPAPLPIYRIGDRFLYDDGSTEEVVAVKGERVTWRRRTGGTFVRYRNLALPKLTWDTPERAGTAQVSAAADALWPLEVGQTAAFAETIESTGKMDRRERSYARGQRCWVDGTENLTVPAGNYDTYRIVCEQSGPSWSPRARNQRQTWYYAPVLGHYVMELKEGDRDDAKVRRLAAYEFPETPQSTTAARNLDQLIQRTLETRLDGERVRWVDKERLRAVQIVPMPETHSPDGRLCRQYTLMINVATRTQTKRVEACREPTGRWEPVRGPGPRRLFPKRRAIPLP